MGLVGATFFVAPAIQYQWAFALGGAAIVMGLISFNQPGGKNLATWRILLGGLAIVAGIMGYLQVREAVEGLEGPGRQECLEYVIENKIKFGIWAGTSSKDPPTTGEAWSNEWSRTIADWCGLTSTRAGVLQQMWGD